MLEAFNTGSYLGLQEYIVRDARNQIASRTTAPRSYELIVEDCDKGNHHVYELLRLLPPAVIRSLIANTLPLGVIHEPEVRRLFDAHMAIKESDPCAGIYVQWIAHAPRTVVNPAGAATEAKFLDSTQVARMLSLVEGYLDNQLASQAANNSIDRQYNPNWKPSRRRAKEIKGETLQRVQEWVKVTRRQYCTNIDSAKDKDAFLRVPMEVGWAQDIPKRIKEHNKADNTPPLLYLVNAIRKKEFGMSSLIKQDAFLFPVPYEVDTPLYKIAEILGSILCSSYYFYGGYNAHLAGGSNTPTRGEDHMVWYNSECAYLNRLKWGHLGSGLSHLQDRSRDLASAQELPAMRTKRADQEAAYNAMMMRKDDAVAKYQGLSEKDQAKAKAASRATAQREQVTGGVEQSVSSSFIERLKRARQKEEIWSLLTSGDEHGDEIVENATPALDEFDEDLVKEVVKEYQEADRLCRQEAKDARKRCMEY